MNFKSTLLSAGLVAGSALLVATNPAQAASFDNSGIMFDKDTLLHFEFLGSKGAFQSDFGVKNLATGAMTVLFSEEDPGFDTPKSGDFIGTCGVTVIPAPCETKFLFSAGTEYTLFLASDPGGFTPPTHNPVFSTTALNTPSPEMQAEFDGDLLADGMTTVSFDDTGAKNDDDFNDFSVKVSKKVPEPSLLGGLGLLVGSMFFGRRRKDS